MSKRKSNKGKTAFWVVAIVVVLSLLTWFGTQGFSVAGGGTIMSITNANFVSNNPELNADAYLIDVVVNQGGESLVYQVQPQEVCQYLDGECPSGEFTIEFNLRDVTCNYEIVDEGTPFYKIYQATARKSLCSDRDCLDGCAETQDVPYNIIDIDTVVDACEGNWGAANRGLYHQTGTETRSPQMCQKTFAPMGTDLPTPGAAPELSDCSNLVDIQTSPVRPDLGQEASEWAYLMPKEISQDGDHWRVTHIAGAPKFRGHSISTVVSPKFSVDVTIINADGEEVNAEITSEQTSQFLSNVGRAKFVGGLIAQEFCPIPSSDKKIVEDVDTGDLRVVDRSKYDQYQDNLFELINFDNNYYQLVDTDPGVGADVLWNYMSTLNALERNLGAQNIQDNCFINENRIYVCEPQRSVIYPELQLLIRADWIGVQINSGTPEISNIEQSNDYLAGDVNFVSLNVENTANVSDSFDIGMVCSGAEVNLGNVRVPIGAESSEQVILNFILDDGDYSCEITATSVNNPLASVSEQISVSVADKDFPTIAQCVDIPSQPSGNCYWEGSPICEWSCNDRVLGFNKGIVILAIIVGVVAAIIAFRVRKIKSGKGKRRKK